MIKDKEYIEWIAELSLRYRQSQIKASVKVNNEMLRFYWSVGKDITERQYDNKYGSHFYENLSRDLSASLNVKKGLAQPVSGTPRISMDYMLHCLQTFGRLPKDLMEQILGRLPKISNYSSASHGLTIRRLSTKCLETAEKHYSSFVSRGKTSGDAGLL